MVKPHLMTIDEIEHLNKDKECIWRQENVKNIWHDDGIEACLFILFDTDGGVSVPSVYYLGLDNRVADTADTLDEITDEPTTYGYARQTCSSTTGFTVGTFSGLKRARSGVITFTATGGSFGPVTNLFLCTSADDSGHLISTSALSSERTLLDGESLSLRISLSLSGC